MSTKITKVPEDLKNARVLSWDLETTNLKANRNLNNYFPQLLCVGYKVLGEKKAHGLHVAQFKKSFKKDHHDDYELVKKAREILASADILVGHYSSGFDYQYFNSRCLYHKIPPIPSTVVHVDTWRIAKYKMAMDRNRLANIAEFLGCEPKDRTEWSWWYEAVKGNAKVIRKLNKYCMQDVEVVEQVYLRIRCLMPNHPRLVFNKKDACPVCGSTHTKSDGYRVTQTNKYRRMSCLDCNHSYKGNLVKIKR